MMLDQRLFGGAASWHHLHSVLWGLALVGAAALVFRRIPGRVGFALALLLFALDESHAIPVGWLANRNAVVAGTFGLLALAAHLRWRLDWAASARTARASTSTRWATRWACWSRRRSGCWR